MSRPFTPIPVRFWPKVQKGDGCWLWTASVDRKGYGKFSIRSSKWEQAHRVAWRLTHGEIPAGLYVCHQCDTPLCVRPDHLFLGTQTDNMRDAAAKGRVPGWNAAKTHCRRGHEFTPENTVPVRNRGKPARVCRTCKREYEVRLYYKKRGRQVA